MAAIEHDDLVSGFRGVSKRQHLVQRNTVITRLAIAREKVSPRRFYVTMPGEVKESRFAVARKKLPNMILQVRPQNDICRSSSTEQLDGEIHGAVAVPFKDALHRVRVVNTPV